MKMLPSLILVCLVVITSGTVAANRFDHAQQAVLQSAASEPARHEPAYTLDEAALTRTVQDTIDANPRLGLSISITDLQTGKCYHYGETAAYTAASVTKLLTATLFLQKTEAGKASLTQKVAGLPAQSQLEKMIVNSDNTAWHALNDILTHPALQEYARSIGMQAYDANANTISSDDVALLLARLASGKLLGNANTKLLFSYMERAGMRDYLVAGVPPGATIYHKTGYLSDRFHDAAVISKGDRTFVLVVFSKTAGSYDFAKGASVFKRLSASVSGIFFDGR